MGLGACLVNCSTGGFRELDIPSTQAVTIDPAHRTVTSARFFAVWSAREPADPEELDVLQWAGQPSVTSTWRPDVCSNGDVEYFGNSWAPPDPQTGGPVLVGGGSTGTWQPLEAHTVKISSTASGCGPSANVPVTTTYRFADDGESADTIRITRTFHFGQKAFARSLRPYMPRANDAAFNRVIHPDQSAKTLVAHDVWTCPYGCQVADWNGSWFATIAPSGRLAGQGLITLRRRSSFPVALWVDFDSGSATSASSVLALAPAAGFTGDVEEAEALCFFDATSWPDAKQLALVLPPGCSVDD
jgi:hypothetical protein